MKLFRVTYNGSWLGGRAFVLANTSEEAFDLVKNHPDTLDFELVEVEEIGIDFNTPTVIHNDNGDY